MTDFRDIIERLERATGGDRELDADIDVALFGGETVWKQANYTMEMYPASRRASKAHVGGFANEHVPAVSSSIDAAVALIDRLKPGSTMDLWFGPKEQHVVLMPPDADEPEFRARSASRPIAILLGLFRAISTKETGDG